MATAHIAKPDAALALVKMIEGGAFDGEIVINALAVLLGERGLAAQAVDAQRIAAGGELPLTIALLDLEDKTVTLMVTVCAASLPTLHRCRVWPCAA